MPRKPAEQQRSLKVDYKALSLEHKHAWRISLESQPEASTKVTQVQLFVAVLGASNYTYVEACASQKIDDWISAHIRAFQFIGGVSELLIPDNLKSAVIEHHRYEPVLNE